MTKRIAIIGGGIAGVTAAWQIAQMARSGASVEADLFESSARLGGIVETVHGGGFTVECGPDAWVTEKPWARELAVELGLAEQLLFSNDATRKTHILLDGQLEAMPDGMRMMVPLDLDALGQSSLFSASAKRAYRDELTRAEELLDSTPDEDESIASFTRRHFGEEVLDRIAAPLLSGVLGGDVETLSVRAVLPQFVAMERRHGSLIAALQARAVRGSAPIFTTLRSGLATLIDRMVAATPPRWIHCNTAVTRLSHADGRWQIVASQDSRPRLFDAILLATPTQIARDLIRPFDSRAADLMRVDASSAIVVALAFADTQPIDLPAGFGFLVPASADRHLLACTFVDQKFPDRAPGGGRLLRAFFGGRAAEALLQGSVTDDQLSELALQELARILGPLPDPGFTVVRRWPQSLPQYAVGHLTRMAALESRISTHSGLALLGNGYRGVGLPDLIRDARSAARSFAQSHQL